MVGLLLLVTIEAVCSSHFAKNLSNFLWKKTLYCSLESKANFNSGS